MFRVFVQRIFSVDFKLDICSIFFKVYGLLRKKGREKYKSREMGQRFVKCFVVVMVFYSGFINSLLWIQEGIIWFYFFLIKYIMYRWILEKRVLLFLVVYLLRYLLCLIESLKFIDISKDNFGQVFRGFGEKKIRR